MEERKARTKISHFDPKDMVDCDDRKRVLVVEDNEDLREMMEIFMQAQDDYEVITCSNGEAAIIQFLRSFRCCNNVGILMDLVLPDINGLRVMSAIREIEKGSSVECTPIRFGVVSGAGHILDASPLFANLGISLVVNKPVEPLTLLEDIKTWLAKPPPSLYHLEESSNLVVRPGSSFQQETTTTTTHTVRRKEVANGGVGC